MFKNAIHMYLYTYRASWYMVHGNMYTSTYEHALCIHVVTMGTCLHEYSTRELLVIHDVHVVLLNTNLVGHYVTRSINSYHYCPNAWDSIITA